MATFGVSYLSDYIPIKSVVWDIFRQDEMYGTGKGQIWTASLAPPLWMATFQLSPSKIQDQKEYAARIRNLGGSRDTFMMSDPQSKYPKHDPDGSILGSNTVQIKAINSDRTQIQLKGLPNNYRLYWGDKIQVNFGPTDSYVGFMEVCDAENADSSGNTAYIKVAPYCPIGVEVNDIVTLVKPACLMVLYPGSHNPGTAEDLFIQDQQFKAIEKMIV